MKQELDNGSFLTDEDRAKINEILTHHPFCKEDLEDGRQRLMEFNLNREPNKMRIIYTWHDIGEFAKSTAKSFLTDLISLMWVIILLVINIAVAAIKLCKNAIKKK